MHLLSPLLLLPVAASAFNLRGASRRLQELEARAAAIQVNCDDGPPIPAILIEPKCMPALMAMPLLTPSGDSQKDMEQYMDLVCAPGCAEAWDEYMATTLAYTDKCQGHEMMYQYYDDDEDYYYDDEEEVYWVDSPMVTVMEYEDEEDHNDYDSESDDDDDEDPKINAVILSQPEEPEHSDDEHEEEAVHSDVEEEEEEHADDVVVQPNEEVADKALEDEVREELEHSDDEESDSEDEAEDMTHLEDSYHSESEYDSEDDEDDQMVVAKALEKAFPMTSSIRRHKYYRALKTINAVLEAFMTEEGIQYNLVLTEEEDDPTANYMYLGFMLGCKRDPVDNSYCAAKPFSYEPRKCDFFESCCWGEVVKRVDSEMTEDYSPFEEVCPGASKAATNTCS